VEEVTCTVDISPDHYLQGIIQALKAEGVRVRRAGGPRDRYGFGPSYLLADANQVVVSLVATGSALGIKNAIEKYRAKHPRAKITIDDEDVTKQAAADQDRRDNSASEE